MSTSTERVEKIKLGVSSCLLGRQVRFDKGHKLNRYILDTLGEFFEFRGFCPEMDIGLGVPREPVRLVLDDEEIRCVGTKTPSMDVTDRLHSTIGGQVGWIQELCGYILKKDSPSCGMERVKVYRNEAPEKVGVGIFAARLMQCFPELPVEEEGRLGDPRLRENFIQRVYTFYRWKILVQSGVSIQGIQKFHSQHKYILMSHSPAEAKDLGAWLSNQNESEIAQVASNYLSRMMAVLRAMASRKNHVNTLHHIFGYLKRSLSAEDKSELLSVFEEYRLGYVPLVVPITLLRHYFRRFPNSYIQESFYMKPHPGELMLLNGI